MGPQAPIVPRASHHRTGGLSKPSEDMAWGESNSMDEE